MLFHKHPVTRHQLLPRYPGGSAERRVCLEGTKKDSTASGASSWTAAAHEAGTHRTHYCFAFFSSLYYLKQPLQPLQIFNQKI